MQLFALILSVFFFTNSVFSKTILLTNDDSWISTNIRATYYKLKEAGHEVILVAPVSQRSGWGGQFYVQANKVLETDGEFGYVKKGAPAWGHEENDDHIWYFNGTPPSCVAFALKYVLPEYFEAQKNTNYTFDLIVSGPNEGTNMGPGFFTISGTMGATYNGVYRDIPSIAFSGSNGNNTFYKDFLDLNDTNEPSTIYANKVVDLVDTVFQNQGENAKALPLGVGLNVNFPPVGYQDESCQDPEFIQSRLTGQYSSTADMTYNKTSGTFVWAPSTHAALEACNAGDCSLPSEDYVVSHTKCKTSVSVFQVDYDANIRLANQTEQLLQPLVKTL